MAEPARTTMPAPARATATDAEPAAEWVATSALTPWVKNPRKNDHAVAQVAESIKRFGFAAPIVARRANGEIIAGHTRLKAAVQLGIDRVPVRYVDLDPADAHLLAVADNKLSETADWDDALLLDVLSGYGLDDAAIAGFDSAELERIGAELAAGGPDVVVEEDDVPEPPAAAVTEPGDVWVLGRHRLYCGDATDDKALQAALAGRRANLVFTDPPYGVDYGDKNAYLNAMDGGSRMTKAIAHDGADGLGDLLDRAFASLLRACAPGAVWYVCAPPGPPGVEYALRLRDMGLFRQRLVWVKNQFVLGRSDYHYRFEDIYYGWVPGAQHRAPPDRCQDTVWSFDRPRANNVHPTMKPVALVAHAIRMSSGAEDVVLDPFCGSGTTLIAAEQLGRTCAAVELDPAYCDVIVERWQNATGQVATRQLG